MTSPAAHYTAEHVKLLEQQVEELVGALRVGKEAFRKFIKFDFASVNLPETIAFNRIAHLLAKHEKVGKT